MLQFYDRSSIFIKEDIDIPEDGLNTLDISDFSGNDTISHSSTN